MKVRLNVEGKNDKVEISGKDMWNLDTTLARIILPSLIKFRASAHGYPGGLDDETDETPYIKGVPNKGKQKWDAILGEMIEAFEGVLDEDAQFDLKRTEKITKGLHLFAEYYQSLWI